MSEPFVAEIRILPYNFAPRGWAFCDGQLLPIQQNTALFSLIGTTYGGDGRTTMALPNLQGRAPMHPGRGPGLAPRRLGQALGSESVTLTTEQIPSHTHLLRANNQGPDVASPGGHAFSNRPSYHTGDSHQVSFASQTVSATGGGQAHQNSQPFLTLNICIALQGIYPSRS